MKISSLNTWQFIGLMVVILLGVGIAFRYMEKRLVKNATEATVVTTPPVVRENTTIDTSSGLAARVRIR